MSMMSAKKRTTLDRCCFATIEIKAGDCIVRNDVSSHRIDSRDLVLEYIIAI